MKRINMGKVKEILRLNSLGYSYRDIAASVGCGKSTVAETIRRGAKTRIKDATSHTETELEEILFREEENDEDPCELDMGYLLSELSRKYVTRQLLWEEYKIKHPGGLMYSQFCERIKMALKANEMDFHKTHKAGEECEVDWAGGTIPYYDVLREKWSDAFLFVAVLPASNYPFVRAYRDQKTGNWIDGHVRAFDFFGGTPHILIPDCTKTAVTTPDLFDPVITKTYHEMATHYDITVIPARPRKPKDKNMVENAVGNVSRRIIAALRNERFTSLDEINEAVSGKLGEFIDRPFKKMEGCRRSAFEQIDKPALNPLPRTKYELSHHASAKVGFNYHVCYEGFFYSVPYENRGKECSIRATATAIEVFVKGERVCAHQRHYRGDRYTTDPAHLPDSHQVVGGMNDERFISWAGKYGEETVAYIKALLSSTDYSVQVYRACMGIFRQIEDLPVDIVEAASKMALDNNQFSSKYFGLAIKVVSPPSEAIHIIEHSNIRGAASFTGGGYHA